MPRPDVSDTRIPQILDAAVRVFSRYGIDGASMAQVAEAAEISKATIYHYFASKEALIEALVKRTFDADQADFLALAQMDAPAIERLMAYVGELASLLTQDHLFFPMYAEYMAMSTRMPSIHAVIKGYYNRYIAIITQIIEQGRARGELALTHSPEVYALALVASIEGSILVAKNADQPLDALLRSNVRLMLDRLQA